jgi:thioredoxin-like negative regulator of GroEL
MKVYENQSDLKDVNLVILLFSSPSCSACPSAYKVLEDLEVPDNVAALKINVEKDQTLANMYHVMSLPTVVILMNDIPVSQLSAGNITADSVKGVINSTIGS